MQIIIKNDKENEVRNIAKTHAGITLITLVITIIVLLILAGVSIAMLTGNNGILNQAKLAKKNTQAAKEDEENKLANNNNYINEQTGNAVPGKITTETKKDNYVDSNGDKATIPAGFTVSKITEEQKVAEGLVIYDIPESDITNVDWTTKNEDGAYNVQTLYNQFVWIPVADAEEYQRDFTYPSFYGSYSDTTPTNSTFTDTGYLPTDIQPETDDAINNETAERNAVLKYNGFYIARYEAGKDNSSVVSKQNAIAYVSETQTSFKFIGKTMYGESSTYVKSAMCSGIQWDMVMKFVDGKADGNGKKYDVRTYDSTRHKGASVGIEKLGNNVADKAQNIYDLEGNCVEYVAEKNNITSPYFYVYRGGIYDYRYHNYRASKRGASSGNDYNDTTFRIVLYIE